MWAAKALGLLLGRPDFERVVKIWVEFAPRRRSEYLNDMTRLDGLLQVRTPAGDELLAIETKYADRFNSRRVDINQPPYRQLAARMGIWHDPEPAPTVHDLNQLVRCHALAAAVAEDLAGRATAPNVLVLHHRDDSASRALVYGYGEHLTNPELLHAHTLDEFVGALRTTATSRAQRKVVRSLELRYIAEAESEAAWRASRMHSLEDAFPQGEEDPLAN